MQSITISSENCPKCGIPGGICVILVNPIHSFNELGLKHRSEDSFISGFLGKPDSSTFDTYSVYGFECHVDHGKKKNVRIRKY